MAARDLRLRLLFGQTVMLGMFCGLLVIPASAVFLAEYGAERLPWTYIAVAAGAIVGTPALARGVRRRTLADIGVPLWSVLASVALLGWVGLEWFDARWVSAPLFVLFPLSILMGFYFVGGQAGSLYDLRDMKARFPRVVLGFPTGFLVAALLGDLLIAVLGTVGRVLPAAAASGLGLAALIGLTARRFPTQLGRASRPPVAAGSSTGRASTSVPVRRLLANRYVATLLAYQMLSQLGTQLADFLAFERAAARYPVEAELGQFIARYTTALNLLDLVFLLAVAGVLVSRFGMKVGLSANPFVVTVLTISAVLVAAGWGIDSVGAFTLMLSIRAFDIAFTDGATRTALNTAYQAVPPGDRLAAQATIEGLGVPVALGLTGVLLLVLQQGLGIGAFGIALVTAGVGIAWTAAGSLVFREYRRALRTGLEQRTIAPADLELDDPATVAEIDRMLAGDDRQVWFALTALGDHPQLADRLATLSRSDDGRIAAAALRQLVDLEPDRAVAVAGDLAQHPHPAVRSEALAVLASHRGDSEAIGAIARALDHDDASVRAGARRAAVLSRDPDLLDRVVRDARGGPDPASAVAALAAGGLAISTRLAAELDDVLGGGLSGDGDARVATRLLRAAPASADVSQVVVRHLEHPDPDVALAARRWLASAPGAVVPAERIERMLHADADRAVPVLDALASLPDGDATRVLRRSLGDELGSIGRSMLATLALTVDRRLVEDAARALRTGDERMMAAAVETLELEVPPELARLVVPVLDHRRPAAARRRALSAAVPADAADPATALRVIEGRAADGSLRPWLGECAAETRRILALAD